MKTQLRVLPDSIAELPARLDADFLQHILANAPIIIFAFDTNGVLTFTGGRGLHSLGMSAGASVGESVFENWTQPSLSVLARSALRGETVRSHSESRAAGRAFETTYGPLRDERGEIIGGIGLSVDITERVAAERVKAESESKSRFLASMSHEVRTPLNSILGFAQLLEQPVYGSLNPRQRHYIENIISSGQHLLSLVNDVLDISKVTAGRMDLRCERLDLASLARDVMTEIESLAAPKRLRLRFDSMALTAVGDARATRQILLNLLANAIKYTPQEGRVALALRRTARGWAAISVTDCGPGIPRERRTQVFDEFAQVSTRGDGPPGTGLGLCLSRHLARAMGGDVTLASRLGRGSTFTLHLPVAD